MDAATSAYDTILENYVGNNGRWQRGQFLLILLIYSTAAHPLFLHLFSAYTPKHRCFVEGCDLEDKINLYNASHTAFALPKKSALGFLVSSTSAQPFSECRRLVRLDPLSSSCSPSDFDPRQEEFCDTFVFDQSIFEQTLVSELNLVCSNSSWAKFISSGVFVGLLAGSILGGQIADRLGRRKILLLSLVLNSISLLLPSLPKANYWLFWICKVINAMSNIFVWLGTKALTLELFGKKERKLYMILLLACFYAFTLPLSLHAYLIRTWKLLHLFTFCAVLITAPPTFLWLEESPRWLALNKAEDLSLQAIVRAAEQNGNPISSAGMVEVGDLVRQMRRLTAHQHEHHRGGLGILDMLRGWQRFSQTVILMLIWIMAVLASYSLTFATEKLPGDVFVNFTLMIVTSSPGLFFVYFLLDSVGRRFTMTATLLILGVSCCIVAFLDQATSILVLTLIARAASDAAINVAWFVTGELYPTNMRAQAMGVCSASARVVGLLSPFVATLSDIWQPLGMLTLGIPAAIIAGLASFLPEMRGTALQDDLRHRKKHHDTEMETKVMVT